ncbi:MAG: hypothetical protein CM1200mP9_10350 [Gammaproteobacteria bacterium]|nr:MAG: hypothetical protein CM1200mP9_10350 [Gammaproteobacteria bacterium]
MAETEPSRLPDTGLDARSSGIDVRTDIDYREAGPRSSLEVLNTFGSSHGDTLESSFLNWAPTRYRLRLSLGP